MRPVTTASHRAPACRALVLLNPNARRGQGRVRYAAVQPAIDELFETRIAETEPAGNDGAVRAALDDGIRTFIAAGGDGTVNALVDALVRLRGPIALDDLTLGAVGLGSSNDAHKPVEREIGGIPVRIDAQRATPRDVGIARWDRPDAVLIFRSVISTCVFAINQCREAPEYPLRTAQRQEALVPERLYFLWASRYGL